MGRPQPELQIFHTGSNWLTLVLAVQRYIYVCHPQLAKVWCTQGQARAAVIATVSLAILHMVPRTMDRQYTIIDIGTAPCQVQSRYH